MRRRSSSACRPGSRRAPCRGRRHQYRRIAIHATLLNATRLVGPEPEPQHRGHVPDALMRALLVVLDARCTRPPKHPVGPVRPRFRRTPSPVRKSPRRVLPAFDLAGRGRRPRCGQQVFGCRSPGRSDQTGPHRSLGRNGPCTLLPLSVKICSGQPYARMALVNASHVGRAVARATTCARLTKRE